MNIDDESPLEVIDHTFYVFEQNYHELIRLFTATHAPAFLFSIWQKENRPFMEGFHREISRFLLNYSASLSAYTDHARRLAIKFMSTTGKVPAVYSNKTDRQFNTNPLAQFVKHLRHYYQHRMLPRVSARLVITTEDDKNQITAMRHTTYLDSAELLLFRNWSPLAKKYIRQAGDVVDLEKTIRAHFLLIVGFHAWFQEALKQGIARHKQK